MQIKHNFVESILMQTDQNGNETSELSMVKKISQN